MPKALAVPSKGVLVLLILMLVFLSGSASADPGLSVEGMNKNSLVRMAGLYLTRSEVLTEGRPTKVRLGRRISCDDSRVRLLVSRDFDNEKAGAICGAAEKALAFSVNQSGGQRASVEIRVVPPRVFYSDTSWRLGRFPKLALVVPDLPDRHAMLANVADLVAHEVFHVVMIAAGDIALGTDEHVAYHFGLCGQLVAIGNITPSSMPGFSIASSDPNIASSSSAAERVRDELKAQWGEELIAADAAFGQELLSKCRSIRPGARTDER